jgi:hypothetical protein
MTSYTTVFGGNSVRPADQSLSAITLATDTALVWPTDGGSPATSAIIEVDPTVASKKITLPDAQNASDGETITFRNVGANSFSVVDYAGGAVATIASGNVYTVYLSDNSTAAGVWAYWQAGAGSSTVDAAALDGAGLDANAGLLRVKATTTSYSTDQSFTDGQRGSFAIWTGGSGNFTMPAAATVGNGWSMIYKNAGSGTLTILPPGLETFDGSASVALSPGEAAAIVSDGAAFSFARYASSSATSTFPYTSIDVSGTGDYTLVAGEYDRKALTFYGTLTGNRTIIIPASARDYYIENATSGAYTLTVKTASGSGCLVAQGYNAIVYCDDNGLTEHAVTDTSYALVAIANGGTGATTASSARSALDVPTLSGGNNTFSGGYIEVTRAAANADFYVNSVGGSGRRILISSATNGNFNLYDSTNSRTFFVFTPNGDAANLTPGGLIGYGTGSGGTVTQATSKSTAVTLNTGVGDVVTTADSLAAGATATFAINNSLVSGSNDVVYVHRKSGGTDGAYLVWVDKIASGVITINLKNTTASPLSEAVTIKMLVFNGATA